MRPRLLVPALVLTAATAAACSGGSGETPTVRVAPDTRCDQDDASDDAKDTVERVGGLRTEDFVVRFAESTRLGVVALVDGDIGTAYERLHGTYGVAVVGRSEDKDADHVTGFQQVRELVDAFCR
jgi:hypothetical protein